MGLGSNCLCHNQLIGSYRETKVIICFSVFVSVINLRGDITSTALGISDRITNIAYVPVLAFGNTISAAVSQNLGAGDIKRTNKIVWTGVLILLIFTAIFSLPIFLFINQLANLYTENKVTIDMIISSSWVIFFDLILCVLLTPLNALASGSGNGRWSLYVYLFSDMLIRVPLILILGLMDYPLWIVSISYPASTILVIISTGQLDGPILQIILVFFINITTFFFPQDPLYHKVNAK